ncbi:MAG TPA: toll/interleukin-1 receptor domain-containing protein [Casimicrobiaceae bacterium]|nr:toll/interleukin-1 receptor domain-containing protein [Casimicrobiaceae bacterium]
MATKSLFISHISEEAEVAALLKGMLQKDFGGVVTCFASSDIGCIGAGENWLVAIERAMDRAKAVIVLCSKASMRRPWVQFEIGAAWMKQVPIIPVCHSGMKSTDLQMPLSLLESVELGSDIGLPKLYEGLAKVLKITCTAAPRKLPDRLREVTELENRLRMMESKQFEIFIDIVLPAGARLEAETIPDDAVIESDAASLSLFGYLPGAPLTWRDIVKASSRTPDTRWLRQLQRCIYLASNNERFRPVQAIYHTEGASYQPQLAKREAGANGTTRYHVHFVETTVAPLTEVQNDFGVLATLLRLGLRFRFEVIQRFQKIARTGRTATGAPCSIDEMVKHMREAVEIIENDALSRGAEKMDRDSIDALFERHDDQITLAEIQASWDRARALLFRNEPLPSVQEVTEVLKLMRQLNFAFMKLGTRRYHEMVCARWNDADLAAKQDSASADDAPMKPDVDSGRDFVVAAAATKGLSSVTTASSPQPAAV